MSTDALSVLERIAAADVRRCNAGYLQQMAVEFLTSESLTGVDRIAAERWRQITQKGWTPEHDRTEHADGSLAELAAMLVNAAIGMHGPEEVEESSNDSWIVGACIHILAKWPDPARRLEIAGALIAAELDRIAGGAP
jgi:hypothetical protein